MAKRINRRKNSGAESDLFQSSRLKLVLSDDEKKKRLAGFDSAESSISTERLFGVADFIDQLNEVLAIQIVSILGEITELNHHQTGVYFALKDQKETAVLNCYIRPGLYRGLGLTLAEGMAIKVSGRAEIYKAKGRLSFLVEGLELVGEGALKKAYDLLKRKLKLEGLFERKRPLPEFIQTIGLITSKTGAVIDDFRRNLDRRGYKIFFRDVRVEGRQAVGNIIKAIDWFNQTSPDLDVLVIIRGGGSLEDLQPFNHELVCRSIFGSKIPTIAGIGHERDLPIASLVADLAPSTPTAAAIAINYSWRNLIEVLPRFETNITHLFEFGLQTSQAELDQANVRLLNQLNQISFRSKNVFNQFILNLRQFESTRAKKEKAVEEFGSRLPILFEKLINRLTKELELSRSRLAGFDPSRNLKLGYSIIINQMGAVVKDIDQVVSGDQIKAKIYKGEFKARVEEVNRVENSGELND